MVAQPWLSILIPVYNLAPYLRECVASVLAQADEGVELLLLDDASSDGSAALMHELAAAAGARVRVLRHERNCGIAAARNTLLAQARGTHVWFLDGDDSAAAAVLPRLKALLQASDAPQIVFFDYAVQREQPRLKHRLRGEHHRAGFAGPSGRLVLGAPAILEAVLASGNIFVWTFVAPRALWAAAPAFPDGHSFEDMATVPRLLLHAASAWHVRQAWLMYRRRDDSITALMSARKVTDLSASLVGARDALLRQLPDAPPSTRLALAHQAARNLLAAQRHARRLPRHEAQALWPQLLADFHAATGEDLALLLRSYLLRGWWWRWWRLRTALVRPAP
jgi:glycosyltransferase involved in cell wall biosynthesis